MATKLGGTQGPHRLSVYNDVITLEDLSRGRVRQTLIRDLAMGEFSDKELALQIGCEVQTVKNFRAVFSTEISEVIAALAGHLAIETAGLWVSKKQNRVAVLQSDIERIELAQRAMEQETADDPVAKALIMSSREYDRLLRAKMAALAMVASEYAGAEKAGIASEALKTTYLLDIPDSIRDALS